MANLYNVADRVEVAIQRDFLGEQTEGSYAATILTYEEYTNDQSQTAYRYRLSVDGLGDTILAEESELTSLGG